MLCRCVLQSIEWCNVWLTSCDGVQDKLESAQREAQVLEIKRQGQLKALEAQRAKKEVPYSGPPTWCFDLLCCPYTEYA